MRKSWVWALAAVLLLAGCAGKETAPAPVVTVAIDLALPEPAVTGVQFVKSASPADEVKQGKAQLAVLRGPVPAGLDGFPLSADERLILQGWLDTPLTFTRAEAEKQIPGLPAAGAPTSSGVVGPGHGALAAGRLSDLKPGWRAVPVDGVTPSPETVWNGTYPLAGLVTVAYPGGTAPEAVAKFRALAAKPPAAWATLNVTGDFMLARGVDRAMRENGTLYPILKVKDHLAAADLTFTNLESPIGVKGTPLPNKQIWFRARPEAMEILKAAGVDGVTVANNHILDYDTDNFLETLDALQQNGIKYVGGGRNITEARKPMVLEAKGVKIAFLGYSQFADLFFDWNYRRSFSATDSLPGVPRIQDDWLAEDIKAAHALAPIVAVAYHWGDEFQNYPNEMQKQLAHRTIDLGADLVLGYHPHAIQGFEIYQDKFIAYSTGNFIMDRQDTDLARESMMLNFAVAPDGVRSVGVLPVWIKAEQPYIMTGDEGEQLLQKMRTISGWK